MTVATNVTDAFRDITRPFSVTIVVLPTVEKAAVPWETIVPTIVPLLRR
jgi:hypothetical protein